MNIHEYQAKQVLKGFGAPVAAGVPITSADEAAAWHRSIAVPDEVAGRTVLLVVDASASQWPVTVAAARLREAGARHVLPLLVHRRV